MRRTTIVLPDELHEELRQEAFRKRVSMAQLIRARLERRPRGRKQTRKPRWWKDEDDPLLKVSGIGHDGELAKDIDKHLYGI